jgi:hypothetical protein
MVCTGVVQGVLPADAGMGHAGGMASAPGGGAPLPAGLEPTMTIATKDAFAALNRMFKVGSRGVAEQETDVCALTKRSPTVS